MAKITLRDKATGKNYTVEWASKTPPTAKESAALIAAAKAKANAPKTTPETNPFLKAIQPPQPPKPRAKPANPLKAEIAKATKPVPKPQRQPTVVERKIAGTQSVTAKYGNSMADDRASTVESEMASYDLKNFGKVTRGDRSLAPSNITDSEWKARNDHRAKVIGIKPRKDANVAVAKQLAYGQETGSPGIGLTKEELQSVRDTTPRLNPVSAAIVDTATRPGILGLLGGNKDSVTQVNDLIYGLSQDPGRADSNPLVDSLFSATPDVFGGDLSGTYLRAANSGKSYSEIDPKQRAAQQVGNFLASILGGSIVGKGVSGVSKPAQMATGFALTDLPGYAKMVADSQGNLGSAAGNFVGSIGNSVQNADKLFDPNTPIDEKTNIALGLVTAGFLSAGAFHGLAKAGVVNDVPIPDATAKPPQILPEVPLTNAKPAPQMPEANARLQPADTVDSGISDGNTSNARYAGDARGWARRPNEPKAKPVSNDNVGTPKPTSKGVRAIEGDIVYPPGVNPRGITKESAKQIADDAFNRWVDRGMKPGDSEKLPQDVLEALSGTPFPQKDPSKTMKVTGSPASNTDSAKPKIGPQRSEQQSSKFKSVKAKVKPPVEKPPIEKTGEPTLVTSFDLPKEKKAWFGKAKTADPADVTGPARRFADRDAEARGSEPSPKTAKGRIELEKAAKEEYQRNPIKAVEVLNDVLNTRRVPEDSEVALVSMYHRNVVNEYNRAFKENNIADARKYSDEQDRIEELFQLKRTEFAQGGQVLQIAMAPDFSPATIMRKAKIMNAGMDVSEEVKKQIADYTSKYEEAQAILNEKDKRIDWLETELAKKKQERKSGNKNQSSKDETLTPEEKSRILAEKRRAAVLNSLRKMGYTTADPKSEVVSGGMKSKRSGAVNIGGMSKDSWDKLQRQVRMLAKAHVGMGTSDNLDGIIEAVYQDFLEQNVSRETILAMLSDRHKSALIDVNVASIQNRRLMQDIRQAADYRLMSGFEKIKENLKEITGNLPRNLVASVDLSFSLIQGGKALPTKEFWLSWIPTLQTVVSLSGNLDSRLDEHFAKIRLHPDYELAKRAKLAVFTDSGGYSMQDEMTGGRIFKNLMKIPALNIPGTIYKGSGVAYTVFINNLRMELFSNMVRKLGAATDSEIRDIARGINIATGRGDGKMADWLGQPNASAIFFAPRYAWSEWQSAFGVAALKASSKKSRNQILKLYLKQLAYMGTIYAFATLRGDDIETDAKNQEWGAWRTKEGVQIDIFSKWLQPYRLLAQLFFGSVSSKGKYTPPKAGAPSVIGKYLVNKFAPLPRFMVGLGQGFPDFGERISGKISPQTPKQTLISTIAPMSAYAAYEEASRGNWLGLLSLLGANVDKVSYKNKARPQRYKDTTSYDVPFLKGKKARIPNFQVPPEMRGTGPSNIFIDRKR